MLTVTKDRVDTSPNEVALAIKLSPLCTGAFSTYHCLEVNKCKKERSDTVSYVCKISFVSPS